jgi:hypothetical protein
MGWSKCASFTVEVKGKVKEVLDEAAKKAKSKDVIIDGDEKKGTVTHSDIIRGSYSVKDQKISFDIEEDSIFIDCDLVKKTVSDYFKGK